MFDVRQSLDTTLLCKDDVHILFCVGKQNRSRTVIGIKTETRGCCFQNGNVCWLFLIQK